MSAPHDPRAVNIAIFGLTVSSTWGNGHATLWRGLIAALDALGHDVTFFERDTPFYAQARDLTELPGRAKLILYDAWSDVRAAASCAVADADVVIVTSYCPDATAAADLAGGSPASAVFYDLDTPVTLARLHGGETVPYLAGGLARYDLVLSYTGGAALAELTALGARRVAPLYGWVDPRTHAPAKPRPDQAALSYLGTYAADRQDALERLFVGPARAMAAERFVIGGAQYPDAFPWTNNIYFVRHVPAADHPAFFAGARATLNVTRAAMAAMGWCPSGRLFEAAACGCPIISDHWEGLDTFLRPDEEILVARTTNDVIAALSLSDAELSAIARRARDRTLDCHTAARRARQLVDELSRIGMRQAAA